MIVDFRIETAHDYFKPGFIEGFYKVNGEFNYHGLMGHVAAIREDEKLHTLRRSLHEWNLIENISSTESEIDGFVKINASRIHCSDDLKTYVKGVCAIVDSISSI